MSATPSTGFVGGGTTVTISGASFSGGMRVQIGGTECMGSEAVSSTLFLCTSPNHTEAGVRSVAASVNGVEYVSSGVVFEYVAAFVPAGMHPSRGSDLGGTRITVAGVDFPPGPYVCGFGRNTQGQGRFISSTVVECISPRRGAGGNVTVSLSSNEVDFVVVPGRFQYESAMGLVSVVPSVGAAEGGTVVTISGA
eukprot:1689760-Rhodomonas_salina.1